MKIIIYGASGMIGQGVLRECLEDAKITSILSVGRSALGLMNPKLRELILKDFSKYENIDSQLAGFDACFFCLGTTSAGKSEAEYTKITFDYAVAAGKALSRLNPQMTFIYVSAVGADSAEKSKIMWERVRGKTENTLLRMPFKSVSIFRPAIIEPLNGIESKTKSYRVIYKIIMPMLPLLRTLFPKFVSSTKNIGLAMIEVALNGYSKKILDTADFNALAIKLSIKLN